MALLQFVVLNSSLWINNIFFEIPVYWVTAIVAVNNQPSLPLYMSLKRASNKTNRFMQNDDNSANHAVQAVWAATYMMASSSGNIFRVTGSLWGESTGHWWIPVI